MLTIERINVTPDDNDSRPLGVSAANVSSLSSRVALNEF